MPFTLAQRPDVFHLTACFIRYICPLLLIISLFTGTPKAQETIDVSALESGKAIEREITGGQAHFYKVPLVKGQFLRVTVEQESIDVSVMLHHPNGEKILMVDLRSTKYEPVSFIADEGGEYKLEIKPRFAVTGKYRITSEIKREATATDQNRLAAERLLLDSGKLLEGKLTKENALVALVKRGAALEHWRKLDDKEWEAHTLYLVGRVYQLVWENLTVAEAGIEFYAEPKPPLQKAIEFFTQALALNRAIKNLAGEALVLSWLGNLYYRAQDYQKHLDYNLQALAVNKSTGHRGDEVVTLINIGVAYTNSGKPDQAVEYYLQAVELTRTIGHKTNEALALENLAKSYALLKDAAKSLEYWLKALEAYRATRDRNKEAAMLDSIAFRYKANKEKEKALDYFNQSLAIRRELKDRTNEAWMLYYLGNLYSEWQERAHAVQFYEQSLSIFREIKYRYGEASSLLDLGDARMDAGESKTALDMYNQSLTIWNELDNQQKANETRQRIGVMFDRIDENPTAIAQSLQANKTIEKELSGINADSYTIKLEAGQFLRVNLEQKGVDVIVKLYSSNNKKLAERDAPNETKGFESLSFIAETSGEFRIVVRPLDTLAPSGHYTLYIEPPRLPTTRDKIRISAERAFIEAGQLTAGGTEEAYQKAKVRYQEAAKLWQDIGDNYWQAITLGSIALFATDVSSLTEYRKRVAALYGVANRRSEQAEMLRVIVLSFINTDLDTLSNKINFAQQALFLYREIGDQDKEASGLTDMGKLYSKQGDYSKAIDALNQAIRLSRNESQKAEAILTLGNVYKNLGEDEKAVSYLEQISAMAKEGSSLADLGDIYLRQGKAELALKNYKVFLLFLRRAYQEKFLKSDFFWATGVPNALILVGKAYLFIGDKAEALEYFTEAVSMAQQLAPLRRADIADAHLFIGIIFGQLGERDKALSYLNEALKFQRESARSKDEAAVLYNIAIVERNNNLAEARKQVEAALKIVESLRSQLKSQELRSSYFATVRDYYELYIDILMRLHNQRPSRGHNAEALQVSERARARSLLETLAEAGADIRQGIDPKLVERERLLQRQLNAKAKEQMQLLGGRHTDEQAKSIAKEIEALTTELQQVEAQIRQISPRYAALTQPQPLSLKEIQSQVLDSDTLLLEYSLGADRSYLWLVSKDSIRSYELPKRDEIESSVRLVYSLLNARNERIAGETEEQRRARIAKADAQYPEAAARLSRMVLAPVASQLGTKRLLVISDGALQYIPFSALPDTSVTKNGSAPTPLIVNHEIISLPSASTLSVLRREVAGRTAAPKSLAVVADPVYDSNDERIGDNEREARRGTRRRRRPVIARTRGELPFDLERAARDTVSRGGAIEFDRLRGTGDEARQILSLVPGTQSKMAFGFDANLATATSPDLSQYRYVHFATHGLLNSTHPELSGLVLTLFDKDGKPQDGFLRANQIFNLKLNAELVVLSACQTGLGKEVKGEGLVSLTRGFMYAGAPRVVVSLWSVPDAATAELMARFYRKMLKEGLRPAAALRAAQVSMIEDSQKKDWVMPYYWAAFTLQGEWR